MRMYEVKLSFMVRDDDDYGHLGGAVIPVTAETEDEAFDAACDIARSSYDIDGFIAGDVNAD